jgi:hypothetical protein
LPLFALASQGCMTVTVNKEIRNIDWSLQVSPPQREMLAQARSLGRGREVVLVMPFADQRLIRDRCGMQKNSIGTDIGNVRCTVPPPVWLSEGLQYALTTAGFQVSTNPAMQGPAAVRIEGAVLKFFVEPDVGFSTFTPEADISVKLVASSQSGLYAERTFYFKGIEVSVVGTAANFQKAADTATKQAVTVMVSAIAALLDRYPQLGTAAAVSALDGREIGQ